MSQLLHPIHHTSASSRYIVEVTFCSCELSLDIYAAKSTTYVAQELTSSVCGKGIWANQQWDVIMLLGFLNHEAYLKSV